MRLLLDTSVLGMICHPKKHRPLALWLKKVLGDPAEEIQIILPAISDYELRRKLIHLSKFKKRKEARESLERLDELVELLEYLPLHAETMWRAAELWAEARGHGKSSAAEDALDGDVILAAQGQEAGGAVMTTNTKHLSRFVTAYKVEDLVKTSQDKKPKSQQISE